MNKRITEVLFKQSQAPGLNKINKNLPQEDPSENKSPIKERMTNLKFSEIKTVHEVHETVESVILSKDSKKNIIEKDIIDLKRTSQSKHRTKDCNEEYMPADNFSSNNNTRNPVNTNKRNSENIYQNTNNSSYNKVNSEEHASSSILSNQNSQSVNKIIRINADKSESTKVQLKKGLESKKQINKVTAKETEASHSTSNNTVPNNSNIVNSFNSSALCFNHNLCNISSNLNQNMSLSVSTANEDLKNELQKVLTRQKGLFDLMYQKFNIIDGSEIGNKDNAAEEGKKTNT
mmetsp:Transcript_22172/g.23123  ORF Transcript_22172/g.23123 Transcript_22172/m.23123 type:complete len:290 (-) Transcript_22172:95-964(-)